MVAPTTEGVGGPRSGEKPMSKGLTVIHNEIRLLTGTSNPDLAKEVADILQIDLEQPIRYFNCNPRGEMDVNIKHSLRKKPVFIMQAGLPYGVNDGLIETIMMLDATRRASSGERTVFYAPMPFQRKDRQDDQQKKDAERQAIGARAILTTLEANGAQRFQTVELHAMQEAGFTSLPYDTLYASRVLAPAINEELLDPKNTAYFSPDYGGGERARKYEEFLGGCGSGFMQKHRSQEGVVGFRLLGDPRGHHVVVVDDVLSTGSTLIEASRLIHEGGALSVSVAIAHGEFINVPGKKPCLQQLEEAGISRIFVTDTLPQREEVINNPLVRVVKIAPLIAESFKAVALGSSLHDISR